MTASLAPRHPWRSRLHHLFHTANPGPRGKHHDMTRTANHLTTTNSLSTGDIDTSLFPNDPDPALVAEAKAAVLAALAASPDAVIDRNGLGRRLPRRLTESAQSGGVAPLCHAIWWLHTTDHLSVIHVGTRTVLVGDPLITPRDEPRARPFLVA